MTKSDRTDVYREVTEKLIKAIKNGVPPWRRPWNSQTVGTGSLSVPFNAVTGKPYRGVNTWLLMIGTDGRVFEDPRCCTYRQAETQGWHVRRGEKGIQLVKLVEVERTVRFSPNEPVPKDEDLDPEGLDPDRKKTAARRSFLVPVFFNVFHASQIEGIPAYERPSMDEIRTPEERYGRVNRLSEALGVPVHSGGDRAAYNFVLDRIIIPPPNFFDRPEDYSGTLLHELAHSTGHPSRLDRKYGKVFGDPDYAREELRAELGSVYLSLETGISIPQSVFDNHAAYLGSWIQKLKDDKLEIFRASRDAEKIAEYTLARERALKGPELSSEMNRQTVGRSL